MLQHKQHLSIRRFVLVRDSWNPGKPNQAVFVKQAPKDISLAIMMSMTETTSMSPNNMNQGSGIQNLAEWREDSKTQN